MKDMLRTEDEPRSWRYKRAPRSVKELDQKEGACQDTACEAGVSESVSSEAKPPSVQTRGRQPKTAAIVNVDDEDTDQEGRTRSSLESHRQS